MPTVRRPLRVVLLVALGLALLLLARRPACDAVLAWALDHGRPNLVALALAVGAHAGPREALALAPLHRAAFRGDLRSCRLLLAAGAPLDSVTPWGQTPLMCAARCGHANVVVELLAHGADVSRRSYLGATAADVASAQSAALITQRLQRAGLRPSLQALAAAGDVAGVERLLRSGAAVDAETPGRCTALGRAASAGHVEVVRLLLRRGANPDQGLGWSGLSPLALAALTGHDDVARELIAAGASVGRPDYEWGATPLHYALGAGQRAVAEVLLCHGADRRATDHSGLTPGDWAAILPGRPDLRRW